MDEFVVIKVMNEAMLRLKKSKNEDSTRNEKIKELLQDETIFFKIRKEMALKVLVSVGVNEEKIEETYQKLITKNMYERLIRKGKINPQSDNLFVKYN